MIDASTAERELRDTWDYAGISLLVSNNILSKDLADHHGGVLPFIMKARGTLYGKDYSLNGIQPFFEEVFRDNPEVWLNGYNPVRGYTSSDVQFFAGIYNLFQCGVESQITASSLTIERLLASGESSQNMMDFYTGVFTTKGFHIESAENTSIRRTVSLSAKHYENIELFILTSERNSTTQSSITSIIIRNPDELFPENPYSEFIESLYAVQEMGLRPPGLR